MLSNISNLVLREGCINQLWALPVEIKCLIFSFLLVLHFNISLKLCVFPLFRAFSLFLKFPYILPHFLSFSGLCTFVTFPGQQNEWIPLRAGPASTEECFVLLLRPRRCLCGLGLHTVKNALRIRIDLTRI